MAISAEFEDEKEKELYKKLEAARSRYDWPAWHNIMEEICKHNLEKRGYNLQENS